jgi:hypothetical protein
VVGEGSLKLAEIEYCYKEHEQQHLDFFYISDAALYKEVGYDVMELAQSAEHEEYFTEYNQFLKCLEYHHIDPKNTIPDYIKRVDEIRKLLDKL